MIEITHDVTAVTRSVEGRALEEGEAHAVVLSRTYDATVDELWDACTSADRIARWLTPVSGDLRLGGRYQLEGNAGGTITECEPPHRFAATWEYGDSLSWIEVRVTDAGEGRARFELEHLAPVDAHWSEFGPGAVGIGWDLALLGLHLYLAGDGSAPDRAEVEAWSASEDGRSFMTAAGTGWKDADLASGTDSAEATARADRTIAAYTTPPEA
jgi:uncharacterized protein YndB with AHSA1/START domain